MVWIILLTMEVLSQQISSSSFCFSKQYWNLWFLPIVLISAECPSLPFPLKIEFQDPHLDWPSVWRCLWLKGLPSDLTFFIFLLLHHLLPTQDRLFRMGVQDDDNGKLCQPQTNNSQLHSFLTCSLSCDAEVALLFACNTLCPNISPDNILKLYITIYKWIQKNDKLQRLRTLSVMPKKQRMCTRSALI